MAHLLDEKNGVATVAYTGTAWHQLGVPLDGPVTAEEMVKAAGIDWEVDIRPTFVEGADGYEALDNILAIQRLDRPGAEGVLGTVSGRYQPIQNRECFAFADEIVGESKAIWHTAGAVRGGRDVWALAKLPETMEVVPNDVVNQFLLFTNNHEGKRAARVRFTPVRVVCNNTLTAALHAEGVTARIWHTGDLGVQFANAADLLGLATEAFKKTEEAFKVLASVSVDRDTVLGFYKKLVPDNKNAGKTNKRTENIRAGMLHLYDGGGKGADMPGVRGTAWGLLNSVTEYIDHCRTAHSQADRRLHSNWFGSGAVLRDRAFKQALALAG